jgi:hypothetical protein
MRFKPSRLSKAMQLKSVPPCQAGGISAYQALDGCMLHDHAEMLHQHERGKKCVLASTACLRDVFIKKY